MRRRIFLICPVRGVDQETEKAVANYVQKLESEGTEVHWPARDTDQGDPHGWNICSQNFSAMLSAEEVHVWYHFWHDRNKASIGSVQDFGALLALCKLGFTKRVVIANPEAIEPQPKKDYRNVLLRLQEETAKLCSPAA